MSDMEKLLMTCIEDQTLKHIPLSAMKIIAKAKFVCDVEKKRLNLPTMLNLLLALSILNNSRIAIQYKK